MKYLYLFFAFFMLTSCSKEDLGPMGLKHGQEVEVTVDHRYGAIDERHWLLPNKEPLEYNIHGFDEREAGYIYKVKATVHLDRSDPPIQDGTSHWLNFTEIISKEKYEGNEPFDLSLVWSVIPGPNRVWLMKEEGKYMYILRDGSRMQLTYADEKVGGKLEEIWEFNKEIFRYDSSPSEKGSKWQSIRATVTHDPDNFGKAYLVSHIELTE